jgi:hypothetical protein
MSNIIIYDQATGAVKQYLESVNTPDYQGKPGVLVNPDITVLKTVPMEYVKVAHDALEEMTVAEKAAVDAAKPVPEPTVEDRLRDLEQRVTNLEKP